LFAQALFPSPSPRGRREESRNLLQDIFDAAENLIISKSKNAQTLCGHPSVTLPIVLPGFVLIVNASITLNYESSFVTINISYVIAELMLASNLKAQ
jgi:hypothetical protein